MGDPIAAALPQVARLLEAHDDHRVITEGRLELDNHWTNSHRLGGFDLCITDRDGAIRSGVELKWCNGNTVYELLWDLMKVGPASTLPDIEAMYVVAAAPDAKWGTLPCGEILDSQVRNVDDLLQHRRELWAKCLAGSKTARPTRIQQRLEVTHVGDAMIGLPKTPWRVQAARVESSGEVWVRFVDGVPALLG
jgi:hypothetical protein